MINIKQYIKYGAILVILNMLSGCLPTIFTGAACSTMEFAKDRSARETVSDNKIALSIKTAFMKNNFRSLYTQIKVEVMQGRVLLTGDIEKEEDALNAVKICWNQAGVKEVINELKVDKNSKKFSIVQYTKDTMITSQIKSKTLFSRNVKFVNYTVITMNNVVYLFGIAQTEEELKKVGEIAAGTSGVKRVVSHVKVKDASESPISAKVIETEKVRDASLYSDEDLVASDSPSITNKTNINNSTNDFVVEKSNNIQSDW